MTAPMTREELPITALPCPFCGTMPYVAIKDRAVISCRGEDCFGPRTTADYLVDAIAQWNRRQVTVAMYQDRVKEILNLTDENDRLRSGVAQTVPSAWRYKCQDGQFVFMENRLTEEQKARGYYLDDDEDYGDDGDRGPFQWSDETPLFEGASK